MSAYRRGFDETKYISFFIKDDELLEIYNAIWEKVKNSIKKEFDSEPVYNQKYLKAKINFHNNKILKEGSQFVFLFLSVLLIDPVFRTGKNYYPEVFLEECKYVIKEKKIAEYITEDIKIYCDSNWEDSDKKSSSEENSDKEKFDEDY